MQWRNNKKKNSEIVYEYVSEISNDAEELAAVWTTILSELIEKNAIDMRRNEIVKRFFFRPDGWEYMNSIQYARVEVFYKRLHFVLGDYDRKKADLLLYKLASLMEIRNLSRAEIGKTMGFEDFDRDKIIDLIHSINKQAAEIRVFALELRARGK